MLPSTRRAGGSSIDDDPGGVHEREGPARRGWTIKQIAEHLGFHPATVSSWLKNGGPPPKRTVPEADKVIGPVWQSRIAQLLAHNADLQGSSIYRVICAEGFGGSYQTLTRYLHSVRGPTRGAVAVTMPIETTPGEEFQFDWSDANRFARRWGWGHELQCFGAVLCWSRIKFWWFADSIDQHHTLGGQWNPLLPAQDQSHPLGCHRPRVADRLCFWGILIRLVTGCSWVSVEAILGFVVSDTTLRTRRDEWIDAGVFDQLRQHALHAYDRIIGLD